MTTATSSCRSASTPEGPARAWTARRLELADVRCWRRAELELPGGLVLVVGPNGAGKTSLVEAVTLGCLGVSPRTAREARGGAPRGAEALHVTLDLDGPPGPHRREIGFAPGRGRRLRLDGEPVRSLAAWRARAVLVFLPDELRAVKGPPAAPPARPRPRPGGRRPGLRRRRSPPTSEALAQRNALLRRIRAGAASEASLPAWEAPMAARGARVAAARRAGVARPRAEPFRRWLEALGGGPDGALGLETSPAAPRGRSPTTASRARWRRRCASAGPATCRPRRRSRARTATTC